MGITQKSLENTKINRQEDKQHTETRTEGKTVLFIQNKNTNHGDNNNRTGGEVKLNAKERKNMSSHVNQ